MCRLALVLGYYLSTNFTNPEIGINWLDTMLTLVRCDVNTPDKLFAKKRKKKNSRRFFKNLRLMICLNHSSQEIYILQIKVKS